MRIKKKFPYERSCMRTRFEIEAQGNWEMAFSRSIKEDLPDILETVTLFVAVKTVQKLNPKHSDKFETSFTPRCFIPHVHIALFVWQCSRCRCRGVLNHHDNEMTSQTKGLISKALAVPVYYNS